MSSHMSFQIPRFTEAFIALVTGIGFLPSVRSHMYLQRTGPHKRRPALTRKRPNIGVPPAVVCKVPLCSKSALAHPTHKRLFSSMYPHVSLQIAFFREALLANFTNVRFFTCVLALVRFQSGWPRIVLATVLAAVDLALRRDLWNDLVRDIGGAVGNCGGSEDVVDGVTLDVGALVAV